MEVFDTIARLIDLRSFSNLWYWIALAAVWSSASHWVLGVPWDMVIRARRKGGDAGQDLAAMTALSARRLNRIRRDAGFSMSITIPFMLSFLIITGFIYGSETAQAFALLLVPMMAVFGLSLRLAHKLDAEPTLAHDPAIAIKALSRHRVNVQAIGVVAIIVSALWGMYQNLLASMLV
ncbi:hypothetical protein B6V73_01075 [Thioclava sp. JM3]|uniref:Component of SufBCD complex n=1 Tax=Thioclava nitratireducens TaxID=1915078 RepID=A0ABN4XAK5_9RHOB|nr:MULTISPECIES: hypothetical protein [Thioclava]AQS48219.1 hypothetical protein BMG03_10725 [Thioclava nitratireducens]OWY05045.1 hypothetical protein B6V75_02605 [Thioclava sp. F1Mire-8]OWY09075.1 hypothetical protein B6V74_10530 [Thioclava sp. F42-5]OWY15427.1 hypothetical protein B6V72_02255 [Thioclava sp. F34-6]OWY18427.1 hypothetical protein B6V73_01075 [Thioclava sp. JM3]